MVIIELLFVFFYFDEKSVEDIFDYIPPQKTNQIFTPKTMVKKMVDMLEQENPGCFDMPDKTFIDPYMKSGLYMTEIVKRLYQSDEMNKQFPDNKERLNRNGDLKPVSSGRDEDLKLIPITE